MNTRGETTNTDALEREVFRYTMQAITEELEINIVRTAYSPLIQEAQDYCIALITADFRTFAQSERGIPIFCSNMGDAVRDAVSIIGTDRLEPGDVFANNYASGQHVNNTVVATPLFDGDAIIAYLAMRTHWADTGGLIPGAQSMSSRSIFHEGARYRGLRLMRRGEVVPEVMETIRINTYQPTALIGDIMAQLAGCQLGARRWRERVMTRWSAEQITALVEEQFRTSAAAVRRAIAAIPDGKYSAEHPWLLRQGGVELDMKLKLAMIVDGERLVVDLSGMPPQTELPINAGREGGGSAAVRLALRLLVDADVPTDHGFFEPLEILSPEGTIVSATGDAPMGFWNTTMPVIIDLFIRAIGQVHPQLVPAAHFASIGGLLIYGTRPDGSRWRYAEASAGGLGATAESDGYGPVKCLMLGDTKSMPIEMSEAQYPLHYHGYRLLRDSGGAGLHSGGPGTERLIEVLEDVAFDAYGEPSCPAPGLAGGGPGQLGSVHVSGPGQSQWQAPPASSAAAGLSTLTRGSKIRHRSGGGGGWGEPAASALTVNEEQR